MNSLIAKGLLKGKSCKILANGRVEKMLNIRGLKISKAAAELILKAGGSVS